MEAKKVKISWESGWKIRFPKYSRGPMLFLEFLNKYKSTHKHQLSFTVTEKPQFMDDDFELSVKASKETAHELFEYIKENI